MGDTYVRSGTYTEWEIHTMCDTHTEWGTSETYGRRIYQSYCYSETRVYLLKMEMRQKVDDG